MSLHPHNLGCALSAHLRFTRLHVLCKFIHTNWAFWYILVLGFISWVQKLVSHTNFGRSSQTCLFWSITLHISCSEVALETSSLSHQVIKSLHAFASIFEAKSLSAAANIFDQSPPYFLLLCHNLPLDKSPWKCCFLHRFFYMFIYKFIIV